VPTAEVDGLGIVVLGCCCNDAVRSIRNIEELTRRGTIPPECYFASASLLGLDKFAYHRRNDMGSMGVELVARPVEVHGKHHDGVRPELAHVGLRHHQQCPLGNSIGSVGLLGVAAPEVVLPEGNGRELRVGADSASDDDLLHARGSYLFEYVHSHQHVVAEERSRLKSVGFDATYSTRQVNDERRADFFEVTVDVSGNPEIDRCTPRDENIFRAGCAESLNNELAKKSSSTGDDYARCLERHRSERLSCAAGRFKLRLACKPCAPWRNALKNGTSQTRTVHDIREPSSEYQTATLRTFAHRERERRALKRARYEEVARVRAAFAEKNRYYNEEVRRVVKRFVMPGSRVLEVGCGLGDLVARLEGVTACGIDFSEEAIRIAKSRHPKLDLRVVDVECDPLPEGPFDVVVLSDVLGHLDDIFLTMERLRSVLAPDARVVVTYYNFIWEALLRVAERVGRKTPYPQQNWLSMHDIRNLLRLSGFEVIRSGTSVILPVRVPVLSEVANRFLARLPVLRELALVDYFVARPLGHKPQITEPSVSIVCPCRNERGHIREVVNRTPVMGSKTELIFVDGSSTDGTAEEIEAAIRDYQGPLTVRLLHQSGAKGKGHAVRQGFDAAENDILMILDADLTVPPEELPKFYRAIVRDAGELVNGVRLVYPMEDDAMRFLNLFGNKFFSVALSWILEQPIKDSLCGTKVLRKRDYRRIADNRSFFGDFDPFGDFDLLFGAARLNLRIVDMPVRYRARVYGETKIDRFSQGWLLLKMTAYALYKLA
jgi:2-polyprenyl-3-methyl-5-hydroxy-6-metoxy-1,4-benzoquinol methylase